MLENIDFPFVGLSKMIEQKSTDWLSRVRRLHHEILVMHEWARSVTHINNTQDRLEFCCTSHSHMTNNTPVYCENDSQIIYIWKFRILLCGGWGSHPFKIYLIIVYKTFGILRKKSYHIISYHIISYHIISYHIISYHIISYHIINQAS